MAGLVLAEDIPDDELVVEEVRLELEEEEQREGLDESYLLDEGEEEEEEDQVQVAPKKKGRRGADLPWEEFDTFKSKEEFDQSVLPDMLTTGFTRRSGKHGDIQTWHCKFARRKGYLCQTKYKVTFSASSENVYVETVGADHNHEVDINIEHEGGNLRWTAEQTKVVVTGILNEAKPAVIRRNLKEYFPEGKMPTAGQLSNKISNCKNNLNEVKQVVTTGGLRKLIEEYKEPDDNDEHKMYIGFSEVVDDQGEANVNVNPNLTHIPNPGRTRKLPCLFQTSMSTMGGEEFWASVLAAGQGVADTVVVTRDGRKACHSLLLASSSPLLSSLLPGGGERSLLLLPDFSMEELEASLLSLITSSTPTTTTSSSLLSLLGVTKVEEETSKTSMLGDQVQHEETSYENQTKSTKNITVEEANDATHTPTVEESIKQEHVEGVEGGNKESKLVSCLECKSFFKSEHSLKAHEGLKHFQKWSNYMEQIDDQYKCTICEKIFKRRKMLIHIKRAHNVGATLNCPDCGKLFYYPSDLRIHRVIHSQIQKVVCDQCGQGFKSESNCKVHKRSMHMTGEEQAKYRKHICSDCGKAFFNNATLLEHSITHGLDLKIPCSHCDKVLRSKSQLSYHVRRVHQGYKRPPLTEERKCKNRTHAVQKNAEKKLKNGGSLRTPKQKQTFNAYMKKYNESRKLNSLKALSDTQVVGTFQKDIQTKTIS